MVESAPGKSQRRTFFSQTSNDSTKTVHILDVKSGSIALYERKGLGNGNAGG